MKNILLTILSLFIVSCAGKSKSIVVVKNPIEDLRAKGEVKRIRAQEAQALKLFEENRDLDCTYGLEVRTYLMRAISRARAVLNWYENFGRKKGGKDLYRVLQKHKDAIQLELAGAYKWMHVCEENQLDPGDGC